MQTLTNILTTSLENTNLDDNTSGVGIGMC